MGLFADYVIPLEDLLPLIQERVAAGHCVRGLTFRGVSMMPILRQGKDTVELSPLPEKLKKYDLPVYLRPNGKLVMHRVVAVKEDHYICLGDNTEDFEKIDPSQMVALVSAINRGGRRIETSNPMYRLYCCLWRPTRPLRKLYKRGKRFLKRRLKQVLGRNL